MLRFLFLSMLAIACTGKSDQSQAQDQLTAHKRVELNEFKELIADPEVQLVDVRTPREYAGGYIDDAVNIDFMTDQFVASCMAQLDKEKPVAIYCAAGGRSAKALEQLKAAGFTQVYELGVGYNGYE